MYKLLTSLPLMVIILLLPKLACAEINDPTRPFTAPVVAKKKSAPKVKPLKVQKLRLTSTLISSQRRIAIINGKVVAEGEKIGSAVLVKVLPTGVRLKKGSVETELSMLPVTTTIKKSTRRANSRSVMEF